MPNREDPIQKAVEMCADKILEAVTPAPPLLAVHFLCGEFDQQGKMKPGYIRKSALRLSDEIKTELKREKLDNALPIEPLDADKQREVLLKHIRGFERNNTILLLAVKAAGDNERFWYRVGAPVPANLPPQWKGDALPWPDELNQYLVPRPTALKYLASVYRATSPSDQILEELDIHRAEAFGRWITTVEEPQKKAIWEQLSPLQSSLLYFTLASKDGQVGGDFLVVTLKPIEDGGRKIWPKAVVVFSPSRSDHAKVADQIQKAIHDTLDEDSVRRHLAIHGDLEARRNELSSLLGITKKKPKNFWDSLTRASEPLPIPGHAARLELLTLWVALLAKNLSGSRHENEPLEFWFVAGDLSEFEDDNDIIFDKKLPKIESAKFSPPTDKAKMEKHAKTAARILEKEHFPWFEDGRYALFFDLASSESHSAVGLCGIRRSTWAHFYSEIYKTREEQAREGHVRIPMCVIASVSKRHGGTSIALCHPQAEAEKKFRMLFRLRDKGDKDKKWQTAEDKRQTALLKLLNDVAADATDEQRKSLAELCVLVADNPRAGGTVVLLKNQTQFQRFLQMGEPWPFNNLSSSDRAALMAHDGATLVCLKGPADYRYRFILTPEGIPRPVRENLQKLSLCFDPESPLAGVGTRRWSAALKRCIVRVALKSASALKPSRLRSH